MSASIAQQGKGIIEKINKDDETSLVAIVLHHNRQLKHPPSKARIASIDGNGFTIEYRYVTDLMWNSSGEKKRQRVTFNPEIKQASEISSRIKDLNKEARKSIPREYPVKYSMPKELPGAFIVLLALTLMANPSMLDKAPSLVIKLLSAARDRFGGVGVFSVIWKGYCAAHVAETTLMTYNVVSKGGSAVTIIKWALTHLIIGFPNFWAFKKLNPESPLAKK